MKIFRYATNGTFDSYLWQSVQKKQEFIAQIMTSKTPMRSCEDVDETALSYAEIKALCAGDPRIREKMELDNDVARLRLLKSEYNSQRYHLEDSLLKTFPKQIASVTERIAGLESDIAAYTAQKEKCAEITMMDGAASFDTKFPGMTIGGKTYAQKEPAGKALLEACKGITDTKEKPIGEYMGFKMSVCFESFSKQINLILRGNLTYQIDLGTDTFGNITRINHALDSLEKRLEGQKTQLDTLNNQVAAAKDELANPFSQEQELIDKELRLVLLNTDLNIEKDNQTEVDGDMDVTNDTDTRDDDSDNVQSNIKKPKMQDNGQRRRFSIVNNNEEKRTGTYGKTAPTFLDNIRNLGSRKRENPPSNGKATDVDI